MNRDKLIEFVKQWHGEQKRKYTGEPYFNHLLAVAEAAEKTGIKYGFEIGLFHDLLEDTKCVAWDILEFLDSLEYAVDARQYILFGIEDLTDQFTAEAYPYLNRAIRK